MSTMVLSYQPQVELEPVELVLEQFCHFKAKPCKVCGKAKTNPIHAKKRRDSGGHAYARTHGCAKCGLFKYHRDHLELAPSLNVLGSGHQQLYESTKSALQEALAEALEQSDLPKGLNSVIVEPHIAFGDLQGRDEGNIRFFLEKSLGDALVEGGWLAEDTFYPTRRYTFGSIEPVHDPSVVTRLRLMIFPA